MSTTAEPTYCRCGRMLLGDREPLEGICGVCRIPAGLRRRRWSTRVKPKTSVCPVCGKTFEQPRMGRPRTYCSVDCFNAVRRHRRRSAAAH